MNVRSLFNDMITPRSRACFPRIQSKDYLKFEKDSKRSFFSYIFSFFQHWLLTFELATVGVCKDLERGFFFSVNLVSLYFVTKFDVSVN